MIKRRPDISGEVGFSEKQMCVLSDLLDEKWNSALEKAIEIGKSKVKELIQEGEAIQTDAQTLAKVDTTIEVVEWFVSEIEKLKRLSK